MKLCLCGCRHPVSATATAYVSGHNLKNLKRTVRHRRNIGLAQRRAWQTKRKRLPIGTTYKDAFGYIHIKVFSGKGRWKLEHHLVMQQKIGRPICKGEIVHHLNARRDDNRPENLALCANKSHHATVHRSLDLVVSRLIEQGVITFSEGQYRLA